MKHTIISLFSLLSIGCQTTKKQKNLLSNYTQEPIHEIQINPVPHPFHMMTPYVVWVNGERLDIPKKDVVLIAEEFNLSLEPPEDTAELHNGSGWQKPLVRVK